MAKLRSPIHSTSEASGVVVVKNWALSVDCCPLQALRFSAHLIDLLNILLRYNGFAGIQKAVVDQTTQQWPWPLFWLKFGFGESLGASFPSSCWAGYQLLYKIHCHNLIEKLFVAIAQNESWWRFKMTVFFLFVVSSWGTHLLSFFTFSVCFKYQVTIEQSMLSSWASSRIVVPGSASMMALSWSLSTSNGWPLCSSSSRLLSPLQNFLNQHCPVHPLAVPGPVTLLPVVSIALPILNSWHLILELNPEIKPTLPALEARSLNQWTTREVPLCVFAFFFPFHVLTSLVWYSYVAGCIWLSLDPCSLLDIFYFLKQKIWHCIWSFSYLKSVFGCQKLLVISSISQSSFFSCTFCDTTLRSELMGCIFNLFESFFFPSKGLFLLLLGVWECACLGSLWLHLRVLVPYWHPRLSFSHPRWGGLEI